MSNKRSVMQYDLAGKLIKEYPSIAQAEMETDVAQSNIVNNCRGKHKSSGGFIWKYSNKVKV